MESEQELWAKRRGVCLQVVVIGRLRRRLGINELALIVRVMFSSFDDVDIDVDDGTREVAML